MKIASHALVATALLACTAAPALARQVDVRVRVDTRAIRETAAEVRDAVREAMREAFGPDVRRELTSAARDIAEAFEEFSLAWDAGGWRQSSRYRAAQTDRETRRFTAGANAQLDLETLSGDIIVRAGSGREIVVEIIRNARGTTDAAAKTALSRVRVDSEERAGRITVKAVYPSERQTSYSVSVDYRVTAPAGTRVTTRAVSGDVTIDGISGDLSVNTMSGDILVTDASRLTGAKTASGDVTLRNVGAEGLLEASTMSGDIIATGVKAHRVDLGTMSGSVTARAVTADEVKLSSMTDDVVFDGALAPRGRYEFTTHSGDVRITIAGDTGFAFEGSTFTGGVRNDAGLKLTTVGNRRTSTRNVRGTFGDGSAVITATSFSGDVIVIRK
jgi:DUF4097 and DUF4098 domain-containing protein YvlB